MSRSLGGPAPRDTRSTTSALGDVWLTRGGNIPHRRRRRKRHRTRMAFDPPHRGGYDHPMLAEALGTGLELVGGWLDCGRSVARRIGAQVVDPLARLTGLGPAPHAPTGDPPPADQPGGGEAAPQFQAEEAKYYLGPPRAPAARYADRESGEVPRAYGCDRIVLLPRDPWWVFTYWELTPTTRVHAPRALGRGPRWRAWAAGAAPRRGRAAPARAPPPRRGRGAVSARPARDAPGQPRLRPARPPALRAPSRARGLPRGALARRGDHRDLHPAPRDAGGARARPRPNAAHALAQPTPPRHARRPPAARALPPAPRPAGRAGREGGAADACRRALPPRGGDVPGALLPGAHDLPRGLGPGPDRRLPLLPGARAPRDHHLRGDARLPPAARGDAGGGPRAGRGRGRRAPPLLRAQPRGLLAPRVRLRARARRRARPRRRALLLRRHARHRTRHATARVRRLRAHRVRLRRGGLRARPRQLEAGVERRGGLPGRLLVPRLLPRYRLRSRLRLRASLSAAHRAAYPDRPQVPPHHRQDRREGALRARARPRAARGARGALRRRPRAPGGLAGAPHGTAADHRLPLRRRALRALVVRGAVVARGGPPPPRRHARAARRDPGRRPRPPPDRAARHAGRLHLGLEGLQRRLARGRERLALPPPPRHRGPSPRALSELPDRRRAHAPPPHPGAA